MTSAVEPGRQKLRNIERNPRVGLNLNSNAQCGDVVRVEGMAEILEEATPATEVPEYVEKYQDAIARNRLRPGRLRTSLLRGDLGDARARAGLVD